MAGAKRASLEPPSRVSSLPPEQAAIVESIVAWRKATEVRGYQRHPSALVMQSERIDRLRLEVLLTSGNTWALSTMPDGRFTFLGYPVVEVPPGALYLAGQEEALGTLDSLLRSAGRGDQVTILRALGSAVRHLCPEAADHLDAYGAEQW